MHVDLVFGFTVFVMGVYKYLYSRHTLPSISQFFCSLKNTSIDGRTSRSTDFEALKLGKGSSGTSDYPSEFPSFSQLWSLEIHLPHLQFYPTKCFTFLWPEKFVNLSLRESNNFDRSFRESIEHNIQKKIRLKPNLNCFSVKQACTKM